MRNHSTDPSRMNAPIQVPPLAREGEPVPDGQHQESGVEAARTACADLTGPERQMCYQSKYGIST